MQTRSKSPKQVTTGRARPPSRQVQEAQAKRSAAAKKGAETRAAKRTNTPVHG